MPFVRVSDEQISKMDTDKKFECPECGNVIGYMQVHCHFCQADIAWGSLNSDDYARMEED